MGCAALVDVGAAEDEDAADELDVDDFDDDAGLDDLSPPHPATATPTTRVVAAKPAAATDTFFTIGSLECRPDLLASRAT
nr:hypothetical protein MFLOJ_13830 [Mycobacterium florentinum]